MRIRKLRGHRRRWKSIDKWRKNSFCFEDEYFKEYQRDYKEILIHPWCNIDFEESQFPQPSGITKLKMLEGLLDVYDYWNEELNKLNNDYSLVIWLYKERFTKSQVVCATGDFINYYDNTFLEANLPNKKFNAQIPSLEDRLNKFEWKLCYDEDYIDQSFLGSKEEYSSLEDYNKQKTWFNKFMKKEHRTIKFDKPIGDITESYAFKRGYVWVGKIK